MAESTRPCVAKEPSRLRNAHARLFEILLGEPQAKLLQYIEETHPLAGKTPCKRPRGRSQSFCYLLDRGLAMRKEGTIAFSTFDRQSPTLGADRTARLRNNAAASR